MGPMLVLRCLAPLIVLLLFCRDAAGVPSWCVATQGASNTTLQLGLDYACGPHGGADCYALKPGQTCFEPNTLHDHASYAYNYYYQKAHVGSTCDFGGSAIVTTTDPSTANCKYISIRPASTFNTDDHAGKTRDNA